MKKTTLSTLKLFFAILILLIPFIASAQIAQWRGPERSGTYPEKELADAWSETGLELLLTVEGIGTGMYWAHPTINNGKLFIRHVTYLMVYNIKK